jgi:hypothetical protein
LHSPARSVRCRQMSAMSAPVTELPQRGSVAPAPASIYRQRRTDRRAQLREERKTRRRWVILSCSILGGAFGLTVGILDVLH